MPIRLAFLTTSLAGKRMCSCHTVPFDAGLYLKLLTLETIYINTASRVVIHQSGRPDCVIGTLSLYSNNQCQKASRIST